ncbi:MAG: MerC domain-containing protein [Pseudomonadota bacterium]|nr:MerC domain-containing protein [Pseudomonadota bacterium]
MTSMSNALDKTAIGLSMACAIHCLLLPVIVALLPAIAATTLGDEAFHKWMLLGVLPTSLLALTMGCRKHGSWRAAIIGAGGLTVLIFTAFFGHDVFGETGEVVATLIGATIVALAHLKNQRICRSMRCC